MTTSTDTITLQMIMEKLVLMEDIGEREPMTREIETDFLSAREVIDTIETLNGRDDCGVEDFIKMIGKAYKRCTQKELLLDLILSQKITDQAKRAIRFIPIENYKDLYLALRQNVGIISSVELSRTRLSEIKKMITESVQSYNVRFRQQFNALNYAVQNEHQNTTARRLALQAEEKSAIKKYLMNLRDDI